ncbi:co-chaperone GrpE [Niallia circulans]|uniref:nucleotide exchange factor GrpE n=1 Tax=Niallia TaxID=2837506 RepID=UPI000A6124B2|nr:nucleotide exchange factor GrpE [Niallia circulans]MED3839409.1 nucleotide exchange factor GrpE [Niallia circulans]MED4242481.1 nucleotide exchange factor GrpE [Niallia circulans]MED4246459.1 nucleotide exchange factor GrpE [Niallia circulans]QKH62280.1 nucleotide exchange factor GrpE [Niallia circulans]SPU10268.1 co-chaperone GrpE [Niallia circulans]
MAEEKATNNAEMEQQAAQKDVKVEETVEEVFEEVEASPSNEENVAEELKAANEKIAELEAKLEEESNRYLRLQADFDNSRRRSRLDMEAAQTYRAQSLVMDLLPSIDNLERALKIEAVDEQTQSLYTGVEMVYRGILEALKKEGVEAIEAVGKEFDPHLHQAVMQEEVEGTDSNIVVDEFQKGYKLKDRVIRPAMVKVSQ